MVATVQERVADFVAVRGDLLMIDTDVVTGCALQAVRHFCGYGELSAYMGLDTDQSVSVVTPITDSEWSIIRPLFGLYVEREQAQTMEAAAVAGVRQFGRVSSEVESDIRTVEDAMQLAAFTPSVITV
jgi:hypothetical protein